MAGQDHETIVRELLNSIVKELYYEDHQLQISTINTGGANYTSKLFAVTVSAKGKEDLKVFAKVALMGETIRRQVRIRLYETEQFFYNDLANIFKTIQESQGVEIEHKLVFPKLYGYNDTVLKETVVLEDLTARGFSSYSRFEPITWAYAAKAVEEMAKFHALSLAFAKESPEQFCRMMELYKFNPMESVERGKSHWNTLLTLTLQAVTEENRRMLESHYQGMDGQTVSIEMRRTLRRPILVHSDFRPSNLMHRVRKDGSLEMIIIDYQLVQAGCPVYDLLFFLMSGSDAAFRRQYQDQLKEHYYKYLCEALKRLQLNPDEEYSREDFDFEWKDMLPSALAMAIHSLPIITVDAEDAPVIDHTTDMNGFVVRKTSQLFSRRMNEIVQDFHNWGILHAPVEAD